MVMAPLLSRDRELRLHEHGQRQRHQRDEQILNACFHILFSMFHGVAIATTTSLVKPISDLPGKNMALYNLTHRAR